MLNPKSFAYIAGLIALANLAGAQVITSRQSKLNYNFVYGAGGDVHTGNDSWERLVIEPTSSHQLLFSDSTEGSLPGDPPQPYFAESSCDISFTTTITGALPSFTGIMSNHDTHVDGVASGAGQALMYSNNPGNLSELHFTLARPRRYAMSGSASQVNGGFADVTIRKFDGFAWGIFQTSLFLPGSQGSFVWSGTMPLGQFRLSSSSGANAFNDHREGHASYNLEMLPSPVVINGQVQLNDFVGAVAGETITVEIKNNFGVVDSVQNVPLDSSGHFSVTTALSGWHWLRVRGLTWVAFNTVWINLVDGANNVPMFQLTNGDADGNNEVGPIDIDTVISHFGENSGGSPYHRPADLDGSGEVAPVDIDIVVGNFGAGEN